MEILIDTIFQFDTSNRFKLKPFYIIIYPKAIDVYCFVKTMLTQSSNSTLNLAK